MQIARIFLAWENASCFLEIDRTRKNSFKCFSFKEETSFGSSKAIIGQKWQLYGDIII